jgi:ATP-dependent DNA helicase 2 subunit 1
MAGNKRVFLVTDNDEPPGASNRQPARTVFNVSPSSLATEANMKLIAQDLETYGITINTFFVDRPDHRFNPNKYWNVGKGARQNDGTLIIRTY